MPVRRKMVNMTDEITSSNFVEDWKEKRAKTPPSLKFKQHSKQIAPKGKGLHWGALSSNL